MGILFVLLIIIIVFLYLYKTYKEKRKIIIITGSILFIVIIAIFLIDKFNLITKIEDIINENKPTISLEEKNKAIAYIIYSNFIGFDAETYETYYIYKNIDNTYYYLKTNGSITIEGPQEEKIDEKAEISKKEQIEKIINDLEKKLSKSTYESSITIEYNNKPITKEELLNKLFN